MDIFGVEIFKSGTWNGQTYTDADLDEIIANYNLVGYKPPVKDGHHKDVPGMPALGWIENIRRTGSKLLADFKEVPDKVYEAIKSRAYDTVSSEIYHNLTRDGKIFKRALKAVALLGADIPAVSGLAPLREHVFENEGLEVHEAALPFADEGLDASDRASDALNKNSNHNQEDEMELKEQLDAANAKIAELSTALDTEKTKAVKLAADVVTLSESQKAEKILRKVEGVKIPALRSFVKAMYELAGKTPEVMKFGADNKELTPDAIVDGFVTDMNKAAENLFKEYSVESVEQRKEESVSDDPDMAVAQKVAEYMEKNKVTDYVVAMKAVLDANPELKVAYNKI